MKRERAPSVTYNLRGKNVRFALLIIAPAFLIPGIVLYYPIINSALMAFQNIAPSVRGSSAGWGSPTSAPSCGAACS